jgi:hypothetical protein
VSGRVAISGRKGNASISVKWENDDDEENWFEKTGFEKEVQGH